MASDTSFLPSDTLPEDFSKSEAIEYITQDCYPNLIGKIESGMKLDYEIVSVDELSKDDINFLIEKFIQRGSPVAIVNNLDIEEMYYVTYLIKCEETNTYYTQSDYVIKENGKWKIRMA